METPHLEHHTLNRVWILTQLPFSVDVRGISLVFRVKFTSQRFLNQISRLPVPHGIQKSAVGDSKIYSNINMLAFCCGDPTLRTSHVEPRLNIDSTTLWCWCAWGFQMCFELSSHLKDFWIKSIDYPFHIGLKIVWAVIYIYISIYIYSSILLWRPHT